MKCLAIELRPIIVNNPSWRTNAVDHVKFNELDHVGCLYLPQEDSLSIFGEVISYD